MLQHVAGFMLMTFDINEVEIEEIQICNKRVLNATPYEHCFTSWK